MCISTLIGVGSIPPFQPYTNRAVNSANAFSDAPRPSVGNYYNGHYNGHYNGGPIPAAEILHHQFAAGLAPPDNRIMPIQLGMIYPNPTDFPSFTATTAHNPPSCLEANNLVSGNKNNGKGRNGPGPLLPLPSDSVMYWLTYECQRRYLGTPQFKTTLSQNKAGEELFQCTVKLRNVVVHGNIHFDNVFKRRPMLPTWLSSN